MNAASAPMRSPMPAGRARTFADSAELDDLPLVAPIVVRGVDPHLGIVPVPDDFHAVGAGLQSRSFMSV